VVPAELAAGTLLATAQPIPEGVGEHLRSRKRARVDHLSERVTARLPAAEEARLLDMPRRTPVLGVLVIARGSGGGVLQVADAVLPGDRRELADTYPVT
jgi:GntR family transcriptional regulator